MRKGTSSLRLAASNASGASDPSLSDANSDPSPHAGGPPPVPGMTDYAHASELASQFGDVLRYCTDQGQWFVFDGQRWVPGSADQVVPYVIQLAKARYRLAAQAGDPDVSRRLAREGRRLETTSAVHQVIAMAQTLPELRAETSEFNHDAFLLNVGNGTLDLKTGVLRPHRHEDLLTRLIPVPYDPAAEAPVFLAFLQQVFDGDEELIGFVQRAIGYSLTGSVREQVFFLCWGEGSNGKSTLFNLLLHLLGDYGAKMAATTLLAKRGGSDTQAMNDMATLQGARFVSTVESDMGRRLAEAQVKELTGGDRIKVKRLYRDVFAIDPDLEDLGRDESPARDPGTGPRDVAPDPADPLHGYGARRSAGQDPPGSAPRGAAGRPPVGSRGLSGLAAGRSRVAQAGQGRDGPVPGADGRAGRVRLRVLCPGSRGLGEHGAPLPGLRRLGHGVRRVPVEQEGLQPAAW